MPSQGENCRGEQLPWGGGPPSLAVGGPPGAEPMVVAFEGCLGLQKAHKGSKDWPIHSPSESPGCFTDSYGPAPVTPSPKPAWQPQQLLPHCYSSRKNSRPAILYIIPPQQH